MLYLIRICTANKSTRTCISDRKYLLCPTFEFHGAKKIRKRVVKTHNICALRKKS